MSALYYIMLGGYDLKTETSKSEGKNWEGMKRERILCFSSFSGLFIFFLQKLSNSSMKSGWRVGLVKSLEVFSIELLMEILLNQVPNAQKTQNTKQTQRTKADQTLLQSVA